MAEMAGTVSDLTGEAIPPYNADAGCPSRGFDRLWPGGGEVARIVADSYAQAGPGARFDLSNTLSQMTGSPTTPMADMVAAALTK